MKILSKHLFLNLLMPLLYMMAAFTVLFIIGDLMDNGPDFYNAKSPIMEVIRYFGLRLPSMVIMIVPLCLLLAVLYSLSMLTRHSEITAMRASGISIYRIIRPFIATGIACCIFTAVINEFFGPTYAYRAEQVIKNLRGGDADIYSEPFAFKFQKDHHVWFIRQYDIRSNTMYHPELTRQREDGTDIEKIKAEKGYWLDGRWWFENLTIQTFDEQGNRQTETLPSREMRNLSEIPEDIMREIKDPIYMSSTELWYHIKGQRQLLADGQLVSRQKLIRSTVDFHQKVSTPFICLIIIFIGIPVGAHTGRRGAFAGIITALGMFFGFYALQFFMIYVAKQGFIPPWTGAWSAFLAFSIIGAVMIHRMR